MLEKPFVFVLMPFDSGFDDIYRLGIRAAAEDNGMIAERVDDQIYHNESILSRIYNQINAANIIIADMTGKNPNVFYEVGYAHAKEKICILLTSKVEDIPFDLRHHRHIVYGSSITDLKRKLSADLVSAKLEMTKRQNPILVELKSATGYLKKTSYHAQGEVTFHFDIINPTQNSSPDIDAIYLYTGKGWEFSQNGRECPSTNSDLPKYEMRHLLTSPLARIGKQGWAPVKLSGTKTLAWKTKGQELKDTYKVAGRISVRIHTALQVYEYVLSVDVECDDIPF